ncbi:BCP1 family [Babesia duncani]|uniref:BCP1 family n=1 Tax=Babesia duncani TaxID=323732 RepID=A0AAD9PLY4_9APIC|nr:BCP1 family [Babesia duncani]
MAASEENTAENKCHNESKRRRPEEEDELEDPIEADFLFNDPCSDDSDGILRLIQGCFKKLDWSGPKNEPVSIYNMLADLISKQCNIGTVIKTDGSDDSFIMAVLTILNLNMYDGLNSIIDPIVELCEKNTSKKNADNLKEILCNEKNQIGLMINERMSNVPNQLIGNLHECLYDDIKWSLNNATDDEELRFYKFTHVILISRMYSTKPKSFEKENLVFLKSEEQFFLNDALVKFMWTTGESNKVNYYDPKTEAPSGSKILPEYGFFLLFPYNKYKSIMTAISKTFKESNL